MTDQECVRRADECERQSQLATDYIIKSEWSQLSIEWHYLASAVALMHEDEVAVG